MSVIAGDEINIDEDVAYGDMLESEDGSAAITAFYEYIQDLSKISDKPFDMDAFIGSIIHTNSYGPNMVREIETESWADTNDLRQAAAAGMYKGWKEIFDDAPIFISKLDKQIHSVYSDPQILDDNTQMAESLGVPLEEYLILEFKKDYLWRSGFQSVKSFIRQNMGSYDSTKRLGMQNTRTMSKLGVLFEDTDEGMNEQEDAASILGIKEDRDLESIRQICNKNSSADSVLKTVTDLLQIDADMNFPENDRANDTIELQRLFIETIYDIISTKRGYTGVSPEGKPRYRKLDNVTQAVEKWVIQKCMVDSTDSYSLAYIKDFLVEIPVDWNYQHARRGKYMASPLEEESYEEVRTKMLQYLHFRESTYDYGNHKRLDSWFDADNNLTIDFLPDNLLTEITNLSPGVNRAIADRKKTLQRVLALLEERQAEFVETFDEKVCNFIINVKGNKRVW